MDKNIPKKSEQSRFDTRLSKSQKELFEKAAALGGFKTLSSFILQSAQEKANQIIETYNTFLTSERDKDIFYASLLNTPEPNNSLKEALELYQNKLENQ